MPGIHTFLSPLEYSNIKNNHFVSEEDNPINKTKEILRDKAASIYVTYYDGYPFSLWQIRNQIIIIEGMIFNHNIIFYWFLF